ncbi:MAG: hypothetical protein IIB06_07165 [Bacteroidetes bacterium]|nr:hypothetical protein [Bacteroidota bacterium]
MKILNYISVFILVFIAFSCSSDDNVDNEDQQIESIDYFPLFTNSNWTYNNVSEQGKTRDSLYVAGTEVLNSFTYTNLDAAKPATAYMTMLLSQNLVRTVEKQLILNGELNTSPIDGLPIIGIPLNDVVLFNAETAPNTVLSSIENEIKQEVKGIPIVVKYGIHSIQGGFLTNYAVDGQIFEDVISSQIVVTLIVTAEIEIFPGIIIQIPILTEQDVMIVTNYYAANIGLIFSEVLIEYELEDLSGTGIELPFPSQASSATFQSIDTFEIGS